MSLKDISIQKGQANDALHQEPLSEVRAILGRDAEFSRIEAPLILQEGNNANAEAERLLGGIDWPALGGLPRSIGEALQGIESLKGNVPTIKQALKEFDQLSWRDCWGNLSDGRRDINRPGVIIGSLQGRLRLARGCRGAIRRHVDVIRMELTNIENKLSWDAAVSGNSAKPVMPAPLVVPPQPKAASLKIDSDFEI